MIGTRLAEMLIDSGYEVALLSREPAKSNHFRSFRWDLQAGTIDEAAIPYADYIVSLAGASVADGKEPSNVDGKTRSFEKASATRRASACTLSRRYCSVSEWGEVRLKSGMPRPKGMANKLGGPCKSWWNPRLVTNT